MLYDVVSKDLVNRIS